MNSRDTNVAPVAVIILNWNGASLISEFLPKVIATTDPAIARIIVVDNGSTDNSRETLQRDFPQVETIFFDRNYGFAEGYNRAIEMTDCKYAVLLNSDVATSDGWINTLYDFMESRPDVGACQPKIMSYRQPDKFEYAGAAGGFIDCNGYPFCRGRIFDVCESDHGQYDSDIDIFWASGACLMVHRDLYLNAGGLDPKFFAHMEEIDLCWRILLSGHHIMAVSSAKVFHLGGGSLPDSNPKKTYLNFRNNLLMLHKNLPDSSREAKLFKRRLLDTLAWAKYMASFKFKFASAILLAHRDFSKMRKDYTEHPSFDLLSSRADTQANILTSFFLKGKKHFSQILLLIMLMISSFASAQTNIFTATQLADSLANIAEYSANANYSLLLPGADEAMQFDIRLTSQKIKTDSTNQINYLIETLNDSISEFDAKVNGTLYSFHNQILKESTNLSQRPRFIELLPSEIANTILNLSADTSFIYNVYPDSVIDSTHCIVFNGSSNYNGAQVINLTFIFDKTDFRPVSLSSVADLGQPAERTATAVYDYSDTISIRQIANEADLSAIYPDAFTKYRERDFAVDNLKGRMLPTFSAKTLAGDRYYHRFGQKLSSTTIIAILDAESPIASKTIKYLRSQHYPNIIYAFVNNNTDDITSVCGSPLRGEQILMSAKGLARDCGITNYPVVITVSPSSQIIEVKTVI